MLLVYLCPPVSSASRILEDRDYSIWDSLKFLAILVYKVRKNFVKSSKYILKLAMLIRSLFQVSNFFFSFYTYTCGIWNFPVQGSNLSCSSGLHHGHGNSRPEAHLYPMLQLAATLGFNPLKRPGI